MVHLVKKSIKRKIYLYLEERTWIEGKSKRTSSIYLGPENKIRQLNAISFPENMQYESINFGLSMAYSKLLTK